MSEQNKPTGNNALKEQRQIIGKNIKAIRTKRGLSQKDLAELVGVSPSMIWQYENGYRAPKGDAFIRLVIALDVLGNRLVSGVPNYPMSLAMMDPLHYGDDEAIAFAKKLGKDIPQGREWGGDILYEVAIENELFSNLIEPLGIHKAFVDDDSAELLRIYRSLNEAGRAEALKRTAELAQIEKYMRPADEPLTEKEEFIEVLYANAELV